MSKHNIQGEASRPDITDLQGDNEWTQIAKRHWLGGDTKQKKVKNDVVNKVWEALKNEEFQYRSLLILESLQLLESYLWPGYGESSTNHHVLLIALLATVKARENLPLWDIFKEDADKFSSFFRRVLSMSLDKSLAIPIRTTILSFIICAFQSLDNGL
ncbi:MAG: hypothetical protein Q9183_007072, partial [Haloplaca sp. 2 TL-2023]